MVLGVCLPWPWLKYFYLHSSCSQFLPWVESNCVILQKMKSKLKTWKTRNIQPEFTGSFASGGDTNLRTIAWMHTWHCMLHLRAGGVYPGDWYLYFTVFVHALYEFQKDQTLTARNNTTQNSMQWPTPNTCPSMSRTSLRRIAKHHPRCSPSNLRPHLVLNLKAWQ